MVDIHTRLNSLYWGITSLSPCAPLSATWYKVFRRVGLIQAWSRRPLPRKPSSGVGGAIDIVPLY